MNTEEKLKKLLSSFNEYDVFESLYILSLYPKNVSSSTRISYLYALAIKVLNESGFSNEKIGSYTNYANFIKKLIELTPTFPMLDDYLPDEDWGEISYFYDKEVYKILYSGPLSNNYDYYQLFEILHCGIDDIYKKELERSSVSEWKSFLQLQDTIINSIPYKQNDDTTALGLILVPDKQFWENGKGAFNLTVSTLTKSIFNDYAVDTSRIDAISLSSNNFVRTVFSGKLLDGFYVSSNGKRLPIYPRVWFSVLLEKWHHLFINNVEKIHASEDKFKYINRWELELSQYVKERFFENDRFLLASPVGTNNLPYFDIAYPFILLEDKEIAIFYLADEVYANESLSSSLKKVADNVVQTKKLLSNGDIKFALHLTRDGVQMKNSDHKIHHYVILPQLKTTPFGNKSSFPEIFKEQDVELLFLDQLLGLLDEMKSAKEFFEFETFRNSDETSSIFPTGILDLLGAYRQNFGVFQEGATIYDSIIIDPSWGSNFRFDSLKEFWHLYPKKYYFDHPRAWFINKIGDDPKRLCLTSRHFRNLRYYNKVTSSDFSLTSPFDEVGYEDGQVSDVLIQSLEDSLNLYRDSLKEFHFVNSGAYEYQIIFFPSNLLEREDFKHIKHLDPKSNLWTIDCGFFETSTVGVRIVFNKDLIVEKVSDAKDRSLQIKLCQDVFQYLADLFKEKETYTEFNKQLGKESGKKNRVKLDKIEKPASFPNFIPTNKITEADYRRAINAVAVTAKEYGVEPKKYIGEEAVFTLNTLKLAVIELLENEIKKTNYKESLKYLIGATDAITHEHTMKMFQLRRSLNQEIEFAREVMATENEREFLQEHKNRRYLIEKLYVMKPHGDIVLSSNNENYLLALIDQIHSIQHASDTMKYSLFKAELDLDSNFIPTVNYLEGNIDSMGRTFREERFKSEFSGDIKTNLLDSKKESDHIDRIDVAFESDFGWKLTQLLAVLELCRKWGYLIENYDESTYYELDKQVFLDEAQKLLLFDKSKISKIVEFLTLDSDKLMTVKGGQGHTSDLPIWEHIKREHRYIVRPILSVDSKLMWGPYSAYKASSIWQTVLQEQQLPFALDADQINKTLETIKKEKEDYFVTIIADLVRKHTNHVDTEKFLHEFKSIETSDIGDMDVCAFIPNKSIFLNIECKHLYQPKSLKDANRLWKDRIEPGLRKVETRHEFIKDHVNEIVKELNFSTDIKKPIEVISFYVSSDLFIWSLYPKRSTEVELLNPYKLEESLKKIMS